MPETTNTPFKNEINPKVVANLGAALASAGKGFPEKAFVAAGKRGLGKLEMKDRVRHLMATMSDHLPQDYPKALKTVRDATLLDKADGTPRVSGFAAWPLIDWVGENGLGHPEISLEALRRMTHRFSAEFAIRPFLLEHTDLSLKTLHGWTDDADQHVRRLVSEGTRPRLPWGQRLPMFMDDPAPVLELLEKLKDDGEEYVRRSVANNLNDIAKDHPDLAAKVAGRWMKKASPDRQRLVKHSLRTLVKQGHPAALKALGYTTEPQVRVDFKVKPRALPLGEDVFLEATLVSTSKRPQKLVVDYALHYRKANGGLSPKIFKWKVLDLPPGGQIVLKKKQKMMARSIRPLYLGGHEVTVLVAGQEMGRGKFQLK